MSRVRLLDPLTISKIAAGEVIERPASVVKELIENALDAGAKRIEIETVEGGRRLIRVTDDGNGMDREDLLLAVERHATSKISCLEDLERLTTLGFRGEALPSIAAVADLEIRSRPRGGETGHVLEMREGKIVRVYEAGLPEGTTAVVADLFARVPARLKYLKSVPTEAGYIAELVGRLAIAHPEVAFRLYHHQAEVLFTPGRGDPLETIAAVYGREIAREMVALAPVEEANTGISGFLGRPGLARATRQYELFFLNGRPIRSRLLAAAVEKAYGSLLPQGKYPLAVVFLRLDPKMFDVNVHPAKLEVRFLDEAAVFRLVYETVRKTLAGASPLTTDPQKGEREKGKGERSAAEKVSPFPFREKRATAAAAARSVGLPFGTPAEGEREVFCPESLGLALAATYILARDEEGLLLVDQHAAHERILYERFEAAPEKELSPQGLLLPVTLHLSFAQARLLEERRALFLSLGFRVEDFGAQTYLLRAVPAALAKMDGARLLQDLLDELLQAPLPRDALGLRRATLAAMACRAAVKAGDALAPPEMAALLAELARTKNPLTCPHGRPTTVRFSWEEIARRFGRR
ncbi:MAG: DNA mismatch repair endonuclease MutL [Bacillota bacterium]